MSDPRLILRVVRVIADPRNRLRTVSNGNPAALAADLTAARNRGERLQSYGRRGFRQLRFLLVAAYPTTAAPIQAGSANAESV